MAKTKANTPHTTFPIVGFVGALVLGWWLWEGGERLTIELPPPILLIFFLLMRSTSALAYELLDEKWNAGVTPDHREAKLVALLSLQVLHRILTATCLGVAAVLILQLFFNSASYNAAGVRSVETWLVRIFHGLERALPHDTVGLGSYLLVLGIVLSLPELSSRIRALSAMRRAHRTVEMAAWILAVMTSFTFFGAIETERNQRSALYEASYRGEEFERKKWDTSYWESRSAAASIALEAVRKIDIRSREAILDRLRDLRARYRPADQVALAYLLGKQGVVDHDSSSAREPAEELSAEAIAWEASASEIFCTWLGTAPEGLNDLGEAFFEGLTQELAAEFGPALHVAASRTVRRAATQALTIAALNLTTVETIVKSGRVVLAKMADVREANAAARRAAEATTERRTERVETSRHFHGK